MISVAKDHLVAMTYRFNSSIGALSDYSKLCCPKILVVLNTEHYSKLHYVIIVDLIFVPPHP